MGYMRAAVGGVVLVVGGILAVVAVVDLHHWRSEALRQENLRLEREHEALQRHAEQLAREREELAQAVERLNLERRVAELEVAEQEVDLAGQVRSTLLVFTELDRDGEPLPPRRIRVPGGVPYVDALIVKFENEFVAGSDALRGKSLVLFRRVYSENQAPEEGQPLHDDLEVPRVYSAGSAPTALEARLWRDFWAYALDPEKARGAGVRVAQGEAVYAPMSSGQHWLLTLEADGGLNLVIQPDWPLPPRAKISAPTARAN